MAKKNQNIDWYELLVFVLTVIGWVAVIRLILALFFGFALFGPLFLR